MLDFKQKISKEVWSETYKWETENVWNDSAIRIALDNARAEKKDVASEWAQYFLSILAPMRYIPGGRIISNAGLKLKGTTYINCYVGGFSGKNQDSIEGIYRALADQAKTLKSEGGYGFCIDVIRPRGFYIEGIANYSPGPVEIAKLWNTSSAVITSGANIKIENKKGKKKIRKGAQMITMSCWHPSIEEFITAKQTPGVLDKFNMSVLITDKFIEAVKKNKKWDLIFPDTKFEKYDEEWNGNIAEWQEKGYPVVVVKTFENANILWDLIMSSTYNRNEPGVIFIDRVNELNNLFYSEYIDATNPCGEQPLSKNSSCNLGSFNLVKYLNKDRTDWDYEQLRRDIPLAVRFQDNINDLTNFPLREQKELAQRNRRIGIGYMGYGSALYLMKVPYGSKKALKLTEQLCKFVTNEIYRASALLAKEKGKFPGFTKEYLESKFVKLLDKDVQELIAKHGVRCSHHTMIAPTGNTGILAENVSGGLEPVVSPEYTRTIIVNEPVDGLVLATNIDWDTQKFTNTDNEWTWTKEGDEHILKTKFNGTVYKIDRNRGLTREEKVMDYAVLELGSGFDPEADYVKTIFNLGVQEHVDTMAIFAKWIDAGISKTINLPNDYSYDSFKSIYMDAYDTGYIKGFTTYRIGTMTSVLSVDTKTETPQEEEFRTTTATKRPKSLDADIFKVTVSGEKWIVFVSRIKDRPYEIFAGKISLVDIPSSIKDGKIVKTGKGHYEFEHAGEVIISDITKVFSNDVYDSITRLVSTSLRHGAEVKFIVEQLNKAKGIVTDFSKCLARALKHYIKDGESQSEKCPSCGKQTLVFQQGCTSCTDCGYSRCG
jgi:ribonucleoside-diphosphate reductase alpha chain